MEIKSPSRMHDDCSVGASTRVSVAEDLSADEPIERIGAEEGADVAGTQVAAIAGGVTTRIEVLTFK
jgi:hypothetical protein